MEQKYISAEALKSWLSKIGSDGKRLYAPVVENGKTAFKRIASTDEISMGHLQTTQSAKGIVFPRTEQLFSYVKQQGKVSLRDYNAEAIPEAIVFGIHPCDAAALKPLSCIFNWDTPDKPFNARRQKVTLIGISCTRSDEYCFCTSVGGSPGGTDGCDLLLTPVQDAYLVEIITDKGRELVTQYGELFEAAPTIDKAALLAQVPVKFSIEEVQGKMAGMFESEVWKQQSARCIGCGACAFVCPTCACFDIQENNSGSSGSRLRCWDSCGFSQFTVHTSGHNPRAVQSQRWRQRLLHKFAYMPARLSVRGCTGCGRCSRACPVDMNLSEQLTVFS
jgi:formate hydrogenlyase subunit 6/NADH:ubiquinone oxidoreductase subunit I